MGVGGSIKHHFQSAINFEYNTRSTCLKSKIILSMQHQINYQLKALIETCNCNLVALVKQIYVALAQHLVLYDSQRQMC